MLGEHTNTTEGWLESVMKLYPPVRGWLSANGVGPHKSHT